MSHDHDGPETTITVYDTRTGETTLSGTDFPGSLDTTVTLTVAFHHQRQRNGTQQPYTWQIGTPGTTAPAVTYLLAADPGLPDTDDASSWHDLRGRHPYKLWVTTPEGTVLDYNRNGAPHHAYAALHQATPASPWQVIAFARTAGQAIADAAASLKTLPDSLSDPCIAVLAETITPGDRVLALAPYPDRLDHSAPIYPYLRAWGRQLGSSPAYIDHEVDTAILDQAPPTAIYQDATTGVWHTADTIGNRRTWEQIDARVRHTHGDHYRLGPYPWHDAHIIVHVRVSAAAWNDGDSRDEDDFRAYLTARIEAIADATAHLLPTVCDLGGTVHAEHPS